MKPVDFMRSALIAEVLFYKQHCLTEMLKKHGQKKRKGSKDYTDFFVTEKIEEKKKKRCFILPKVLIGRKENCSGSKR